MTHAGVLEIQDGSLLPWQQPKDPYTLWQARFNEIIPEICSKLHAESFSEIDSVAAANTNGKQSEASEAPENISSADTRCLSGYNGCGGDYSGEEDEDSKETTHTTRMCSFGRTSAVEKLRTLSCATCCCSSVDEGDLGVMCAWGGAKTRTRTQTSGSSLSKRKPYNAVFQRLLGDNKFKYFEFNHVDDITEYMTSYRKHHTVADVGREVREPPKFGVDVPDPYAVRIKNICSIVDSCDFTALRPVTDTDPSCADFSSALSTISADSGGKDKGRDHEKAPPGDSTKRKKGDKPPLTNTRSVPSLAPVRPKAKGEPHELGRHTDNSNKYVEEYERLKRHRELHKSNTLPQILLRADDPTSGSKPGSRPSSDSSGTTHRLLDELESPFKRLLKQKHKATTSDFLRETYNQKSTSVKLSEFFSKSFLGDGCLRTSLRNAKAAKPGVKVKERRDKEEKEGTHFPEIVVGQNTDKLRQSKDDGAADAKPEGKSTCAKVISVSFDDIEVPKPKPKRKPESSPRDESLPIEYQLKKRQMQKAVDLMSAAR